MECPAPEAAGTFFVTQLGKYIPGSVWPAALQMQFGARWGAPRRLLLASNLLLIVTVTASGTIAGALTLPFASPTGLERYWWLLVLLVPLLVCLHPRAVPWLVDTGLRIIGREPVGARLSMAGLARAGAWSVVTWLVLGAHVAVLSGGFDEVTAELAVASIGGMGLAWAAGLAFIPAPAGAGVREGVLVLTLGPFIGVPGALTVALASRVQLLLADVLLALAGGALLRRR